MSYTGVLINPPDRSTILQHIPMPIPPGWKVICHHMTTNMNGPEYGPAAAFLGQEVALTVNSFAADDKVMAVGVETEVPSNNKIKHITVAVNVAGGGKPFFSNLLTDWQPLQPFQVHGVVTEMS